MAGRGGGKAPTIDQQTRKDLGDAFFLFAYDESGKVSANEVGACIRSVGLNPDEKQLNRIKDQINKQFKGSVSVDDLCKILSQPEYSDLRTSPEEVRDACRIFDKLGDGMVQTQDFTQALRSLGEPLSEPVLSSVLREVDPNGDNQFNIDSFVNILMKPESRK